MNKRIVVPPQLEEIRKEMAEVVKPIAVISAQPVSTTKVYNYKSVNGTVFQNLGRFSTVRFSPKENDYTITKDGFRKSLNVDVFCFVLIDPQWKDEWKSSNKQTFKIRNKIDLQKMQSWYESTKKLPHVKISPFFIV